MDKRGHNYLSEKKTAKSPFKESAKEGGGKKVVGRAGKAKRESL